MFPGWNVVADGPRSFRVYCDTCLDGFAPLRKKSSTDQFIQLCTPIVQTSIPNDIETNWFGELIWRQGELLGEPNICRDTSRWLNLRFSPVTKRWKSWRRLEGKSCTQRGLEFLTAYRYGLEYIKVAIMAMLNTLSALSCRRRSKITTRTRV